MPDFGVLDPILVHEKMGEDGRPNLWLFGGEIPQKWPILGFSAPILVIEKMGDPTGGG